MNCIKPSGPYIAFLVIVLAISFVGIPKNENKTYTNDLVKEVIEDEELDQKKNLTILNLNNHE